MNKVFLSFAAAFGAVLIAAPVIADEAPEARPVRHARPVERAPAQAPARAAPVQQANWTGGQVGGQGGVSSMAQGFAEPGSYLFPAVCGSSGLCSETPFSFTGTKTSATGGGFVGTFDPRLEAVEAYLLQRLAKAPPSRLSQEMVDAARLLRLIATAYRIGDETYRDFTDGAPLYPPLVSYAPEEQPAD